MEELKKQRDEACKDYLDLKIKIEELKILVKDLIKKEQHKIETNEYIIMYLEELGDLKQILNILERKN